MPQFRVTLLQTGRRLLYFTVDAPTDDAAGQSAIDQFEAGELEPDEIGPFNAADDYATVADTAEIES